MTESIHSPEYQHVLAKLVKMRNDAGLSQRDLAKLLGRENSFVWRIETGKRRLDVVEFFWVCKALGRNAEIEYRDMIQKIIGASKVVKARKGKA
ncbi:MAG: helix-turn-helix transcriptional regulator [bacterium]